MVLTPSFNVIRGIQFPFLLYCFQYLFWMSFNRISFTGSVSPNPLQLVQNCSVIHFHELQSQSTPPVHVHCTALGLPAPAVTAVTAVMAVTAVLVHETTQTTFYWRVRSSKIIIHCLRLLSVLYSLTQGQKII